MKAALHLAGPADIDRLTALVSACHAETGRAVAPEPRDAALRTLVAGIPHGAAYLVGPARAPIGYVVLTFGWSVVSGGLDGWIDEIYLRPAVRGRGIATETIAALGKVLAGAGVATLHLQVEHGNEKALRLYARAGFERRDSCLLMTRHF